MNPKLKISTKEEWIHRVSQQPLYKTGPNPLIKFIILVAVHNAIPNPYKPYLLKKDRVNPKLDYLNLSEWNSDDHKTIEHIAPQNNNNGWDESLYNDLNTIHLLGNLTLLPNDKNSTIGDQAWNKKQLFYKAAAGTTTVLNDCIKKAKELGIDFGLKAIKMLKASRCVPIISTVAAATEWDKNIVEERTINIAELLLEEINEWLEIYN